MEKIVVVSPLVAILLILSACVSTVPPEEPGITRIDTATAKEYFDRGVLFIDVRGVSYDEGHIPKSINIYEHVEFTETSLSKVMSKDQEVVFYCDGPSCGLSIKTSRKAVSWGYSQVYHYREGYPAWKAAGYPIE
ncbi:MAG: rhodanese-like domain-containing protein [Chloroflexi bacterium]|jgi:rhodanese-related sulfurtransferase|nr:rhodanese-like domain-containing protein [Chloroflexota bacterium]